MKAIQLAGRLSVPDGDAKPAINQMPDAVYEPDACIRASPAAARRVRSGPADVRVHRGKAHAGRDARPTRHLGLSRTRLHDGDRRFRCEPCRSGSPRRSSPGHAQARYGPDARDRCFRSTPNHRRRSRADRPGPGRRMHCREDLTRGGAADVERVPRSIVPGYPLGPPAVEALPDVMGPFPASRSSCADDIVVPRGAAAGIPRFARDVRT